MTAWPVSGQHPAQVSLTDAEITPEQAHFMGCSEQTRAGPS